MPHLEGKAEGGVFATNGQGSGNSNIDGLLLLGLRYSF
jgi:hypothetical protein